MGVHSSFIYNRQNVEATKISLSQQMGNVVHSDNVMVFNAQKKRALKSRKDVTETNAYY